MVITTPSEVFEVYKIETKSTGNLKYLICSFIIEQGEDYITRYRYDCERITGDFRRWLSLRERYTPWTDIKLYGLFKARFEYVYELKAQFDAFKAKFGLNNKDIAAMFGYASFSSFMMSSRRNKNIVSILKIAARIAP